MIKDVKYWRRWEEEYILSTPADYQQNLRIFEEMMELAQRLGVWPPKDSMEGIEVDIKIAKVVNSV